jgi:regulator of replication initiation timing
MKRSRFRGQSDSLDLLLDTICNTFGGIIFIACLVTLLARETNTGPYRALEEADTEMLQRRIAVAESDLARLEVLIAGQSESRASLETLRRKRGELNDTIAKLRGETAVAAAEVGAVTGDLQQLRAENRPLRAEAERLLNELTASEKDIARLQSRQRELEKKTAAARVQGRENVRFPKERPRDKAPFWVILKHGRVYPLRGDDGDLNTTSLEWESSSTQDKVTPLPGHGGKLPADADSLAAQLRAVAGGKQFVAVCLYPDSYDTWRDYRRLIQTTGLDYGLSWNEQHAPLYFGATGSVPPPL